MKCKKCGAELKPNTMFCPECGEQNMQLKTNKSKGKVPKSVKGIMLIAILIIAGIMLYRKIPRVVDLSKYVECSIDGYDGYGVAKCKTKDTKMLIDLAKIIKHKNGISEEEAETIASGLTCEFKASKGKHLSNGDVVKIKCSVDKDFLKDYGVWIKAKTKKVKVKDLKKTKKVDIFKNLKLNFKEEGDGLYTDETIYLGERGKEFECTVSPTEKIQVGDEVTVTCNIDSPVDGMVPKNNKTKIKVTNDTPYETSDLRKFNKKDFDAIKDYVSFMTDSVIKGDRPDVEMCISEGYEIIDPTYKISEYKISDDFVYVTVTNPDDSKSDYALIRFESMGEGINIEKKIKGYGVIDVSGFYREANGKVNGGEDCDWYVYVFNKEKDRDNFMRDPNCIKTHIESNTKSYAVYAMSMNCDKKPVLKKQKTSKNE